jgi:hypothetical protein
LTPIDDLLYDKVFLFEKELEKTCVFNAKIPVSSTNIYHICKISKNIKRKCKRGNYF